jgi:signal transduction histidine kinase
MEIWVMEAELSAIWVRLLLPWLALGLGFCLLVMVLGLMRRARLRAAEQRHDRRVRAELEAYARLDTRLPEDGDPKVLGKRVCKVVAQVSPFRRVAMLGRETDGRLIVAASAGMDDRLVEALNGWGERAASAGAGVSRGLGEVGMRSGVRMAVGLKPWTRSFLLDLTPKDVGTLLGGRTDVWMASRVWMAPLWTTAGQMVGAIAVWGNEHEFDPRWLGDAAEDLAPIEALAAKLARTMENAALAERLLQSEKLAGLGQLAGGVAHALNNPLTAVMGFAELIAETTDEARVREDAATIVREAMRMRETVQSLLDVWRPAKVIDEAVNLTAMVRELAAACEGKLEARGVRLVVEIEEEVAAVRGSRERLQQVMEHLLNNAAQAVAVAQSGAWGDAIRPVIRVAVRQDERGVQMIVSDTGMGFADAARVFDPFYTTQQVGPGLSQGSGLGLSICYGIVREHGGEISAFNLHPRGAAVVVELPVKQVVSGELVVVSEVGAELSASL